MLIINSTIVRQTILFLSVLISGGNLIFSRSIILLLIFVLYFALCKGHMTVKKSTVFVLSLLAVILFISLIHPNGIHFQSIAIRFANFLVALILLDLYLKSSLELIKADFYNILKFMPVQAILTFVLGTLTPFLFVEVSTSATKFYTLLGVLNYHVTISDLPIRPNGFFFEPGVFQFYLNIFLYLSLFVFKNKKNSYLATVAVLLTMSSTGVFILSLILGWYFLKEYINKGSLFTRLIKLFISLLLFSGSVYVTYENMNEKFTGQSNGSFLAREYDTMTGINIALENPFIGIGFDYNNYYKSAEKLGYQNTSMSDESIQNRNSTNGIVMMLYSIGFPLSVVFLIGMFNQRILNNKFLGGLIVFISLLTESLIFTPIFLMFLFSGLLLYRK